MSADVQRVARHLCRLDMSRCRTPGPEPIRHQGVDNAPEQIATFGVVELTLTIIGRDLL
jgi:hypothetical protein